MRKKCIARYSKGLRNRYGEHLVNLCESNISWKKSQIQGLYFTVDVYNMNNMYKVTRHKVKGDGCIWEWKSLMFAKSVVRQVKYGEWWYA